MLNTDTLTLPFRATAFQYRVTPGAGTRVTLLSFNTSDIAPRFQGQGQPGQAAAWNRVLKVPGFSQRV